MDKLNQDGKGFGNLVGGAADNARLEPDRGPLIRRPRIGMMAFALGISFALLGAGDASAQAVERIVNPEFSVDMLWGSSPYAVNSRWNEYNLHKNAGRVSDAAALDGYALQIEAGAAWTAHQLLGYSGYGGRGQSIMPCPEPGTQYTLSARAKKGDGSGSGEVVLEFFLSTGDRVLSPKILFSNSSYETKSETFTIPSNTVWCIAWARKKQKGDVFVDWVSLKATVNDTPSVPTGFTAVESSGRQIRLQWNQVSGCLGYEIQRKDSSDPDTDYQTANIVLSSSTTSYSDGFDLETSKLNPGNFYRYRLRAVGDYGPSGWTSITASTPALTSSPGNTTYYIDATGGDDSNSGTSSANAWQTFYPVGRLDLAPRDSVLLKCGEAWNEPLNLMGSGSSASPIIVSSYGTGAKPYINVECRANAAIRTINESYYEFSNLEVANHQDPAEHPHALLHGKRLGRTYAVEAGRQWGTITHLYFDHITISGTASIYATLGNAGEDSQHRSAGLRITHSARGGKATGSPVISDVRVTNCDIDHVQHKGMEIGWINGCTIQSNRVTRSGHAAIHGREIYNGYFADNYFGDTGLYLTESDNAALDWYKGANCTVENNIFNRTYGADKCQAMTWDGVDDFIIQYNYCQDIAAGFIVFNSDANRNIVRYNIIQGMGDPMFRLMGLQDSEIYNNLGYRYSGEEGSLVTIGNEVGGDRPSLNNRIENNILYTMDASDPTELIKLWGNHAGNVVDNNVYFGNFTDAPPAGDVNAKTADPLFVNPGGGSVDEINHTFNADGYKLSTDSPYIGAGNSIPNNGGRDFWGTPLPGTAPAIGAHEFPGAGTPVELPLFDDFETGEGPANYAAAPYPAGVWHMQDAAGSGWSVEAQDTSVVIADINSDSNNVMQLGWGYDEVAVLFSTTTPIDLNKGYTFSGSWEIDTVFSPLGFIAGIAEFSAADGSLVQRLTPDSNVFGDTVSPAVGETGSFEVTVTSAQLQSAGVTAGNTIGLFLHHDDDGTLYDEADGFADKGDVYLIDDISLYESDPFEQWMLAYGVSGATNDADSDGLDNWNEYIFGGNPTNSDASSVLPMVGMVPESGTNWLEYVYRRRNDYVAAGLTYTVEASTNLVSGTWSTNGVLDAGYGSVDAEIDSVTNRVSTEGQSEQFIRLRVE